MIKVVSIVFHYSYIAMKPLEEKFKGMIDLSVYSAKLLSEDANINKLYKEIEEADVLILNRTASDSIWAEVDGIIHESKGKKVYVGDDLLAFTKTKEEVEIGVKANEYFTLNGIRNLENMVKFILTEEKLLEFEYEKPKEIPWNGLFHPDFEEYFEARDEYLKEKPLSKKGNIGIIASRSYFINNDIEIENKFIRSIEEKGYGVVPIFTYYNKDNDNGELAHGNAINEFFFDENGNRIVDVVIKLISFSLVEGNSSYGDFEEENILSTLNCPIMKPIVSSNMTIEEWEESLEGAVKDISWSVALPEIEGNIEPVFVGATYKENGLEKRVPVEERCEKVVSRGINFIKLKKKANKDKKIGIILNNSPCASIEANVGTASNLDALQSVVNILNKLKDEGYEISDIPEDGKALAKLILDKKAISEFRWTTVDEIVKKGGALDLVSKEEYMTWFNKFSEEAKAKIIKDWGNPPGEERFDVPPSMVYDGKIIISGIQFGNVVVCVQPKRGCSGPTCNGTVCKILHDPAVAPTHQYIGTYRWLEEKFKCDALIHMGTHGNLEFLPGKAVGLSKDCYTDMCIGNMPYFNIYNADNPPEGTIAKRRALATIVDHMQTVITNGELYGPLIELENLINSYEMMEFKDNGQKHILEHMIGEEIKKADLDSKIKVDNIHNEIDKVIAQATRLIGLIKATSLEGGKHIIGELPLEEENLLDFINAILRYESYDEPSLRNLVGRAIGLDLEYLLNNPDEFNRSYEKLNSSVLQDLDFISKNVIKQFINGKSLLEDKNIYKGYEIIDEDLLVGIEIKFLDRTLDIKKRIEKSDEIGAIIKALNGDFIKSGPAGVINKGREDILPTGRNFYTLDPETLPTRAAYEIGKRLGEKTIEKHLKEEGTYPENFAMYLMANDFMWSDGEGMCQLFYLLGVKPIWKASGKVESFKVIPLEELNRPRIDVTVKISGITRDSFYSRIEILDMAIRAVAALDEPIEMNYVRKHTLENLEKGEVENFEAASSRIFGSKAGTYFSAVTGLIYSSAWKEKEDIADVFMYYNGYSYGKNLYGKRSLEEFKNTLSTVDITYNKISADTHDLLGCCTYFSTHGGMTAAAKKLSKNNVKAYYGDTRESLAVEVRDLSEEIERVVRGKLINPKWIEGQKKHGYTGASEISTLVGRVYGWDATTDEVDDKLFDGITKTFVFDDDNREFFNENNPWALEEIERRLIEAYERGLWETDDEIIEELKEYYLETEGFIEEGMVDVEGNYQGGSIDVVDLKEVSYIKENIENIKDMFK
ncbi:MAG: cobaltochelatase subunit CobN [Clostridium sp.]|uniref:cobaltochelatase subunit CobN n=1 Tax=Clostridium sp. TaxID=1506 RepID=UPI003F376EFE